jgi:hypothetical protein
MRTISVSRAGCFFAVTLAFAAGLFVTSARSDEVAFELRIEKGRMPADKRLIRVKQGDAVKLRWSADQTTILHLHGYDIETKVEPGGVAEMHFTARATGRFPVSVHKPTQGGGHTHDPPLIHVEVVPH